MNARLLGAGLIVSVLLLSFAMLATPASADGTADTEGTTESTTVTAAEFLATAQDGKIVMTADTELASALIVESALTIDTAGFSLTVASGPAVIVDGGELTVYGASASGLAMRILSGSVVFPEGEATASQVLLGASGTVAVVGTAGTGGLTVTQSAVGGSLGTGTMAVTGKASVRDALALGDGSVLVVNAEAELSVPKDATVSGGSVRNLGTLIVEGTVSSHIENTGRISASVSAVVPDHTGGVFDQVKPTVACAYTSITVTLGKSLDVPVTVTDGADLKIEGASWAEYADGRITGTPDEASEFVITATPYVGDNEGQSIKLKVVVADETEPVPEITEETRRGIGIGAIVIAIILFALAGLIITRI